jgi:hypothetical protein
MNISYCDRILFAGDHTDSCRSLHVAALRLQEFKYAGRINLAWNPDPFFSSDIYRDPFVALYMKRDLAGGGRNYISLPSG